jgi:hypothetical protein
MRSVLFVALIVCFCSLAAAETVIVRRPAVIVTAQDHALVLARRGALIHSSCGQTEGIGCGPTREDARRNCCYFGQRQIVEESCARSADGRWFAVIRYR